jgi:hypothetical protein
MVDARDLLGHTNIIQTSTYLQSTARSLGLAIERKSATNRSGNPRSRPRGTGGSREEIVTRWPIVTIRRQLLPSLQIQRKSLGTKQLGMGWATGIEPATS